MKSNLIKCDESPGCASWLREREVAAPCRFGVFVDRLDGKWSRWRVQHEGPLCAADERHTLTRPRTKIKQAKRFSELDKISRTSDCDECVVTLSPSGKSFRVVQHHVALPYRCRGRLGQEEAFSQVRERACSFATDLALLALAVCARCHVWATQVS
jgi:hypothetical protein